MRRRTKRSKGCLTRNGMLHMMFKFGQYCGRYIVCKVGYRIYIPKLFELESAWLSVWLFGGRSGSYRRRQQLNDKKEKKNR